MSNTLPTDADMADIYRRVTGAVAVTHTTTQMDANGNIVSFTSATVPAKTLGEMLPGEFTNGEFSDTPAYAFKDELVVGEFTTCRPFPGETPRYPYRPWKGNQKFVLFWYELANGYAVGFNENPSRGWSFPVVRVK